MTIAHLCSHKIGPSLSVRKKWQLLAEGPAVNKSAIVANSFQLQKPRKDVERFQH